MPPLLRLVQINHVLEAVRRVISSYIIRSKALMPYDKHKGENLVSILNVGHRFFFRIVIKFLVIHTNLQFSNFLRNKVIRGIHSVFYTIRMNRDSNNYSKISFITMAYLGFM